MRNSWPQITLVTPSYNKAAFLEQTILSVLGQGYPSLEYIIMDGGSTDGSQDIIRRYESQIAHWESGPDGGQGAAIVEGWHKGTGELIGWLNADDVLLKGALFRIAEKYRNENLDIVAGEEILMDEQGRIRSYYPKWKGPRWLYLAGLLHPGQPGSFYRRSTAEAVGFFDTSLHCAMEYDLLMRMLKTGARIGFVDGPVVGYRQYADTKTAGLADICTEEIRAVYRRYAPWPFSEPWVRETGIRLLRYPFSLRYLSPRNWPHALRRIRWKVLGGNISESLPQGGSQ